MVTWNIVSKILISQNCREYSYIVALFKVISMFIKAFPFFPVTENSFEIFDLYIRVLSRSGCFCTLRHGKMLVPLLTILFSHLILLIKFLQIPHDFLTDQYFSDVKIFLVQCDYVSKWVTIQVTTYVAIVIWKPCTIFNPLLAYYQIIRIVPKGLTIHFHQNKYIFVSISSRFHTLPLSLF